MSKTNFRVAPAWRDYDELVMSEIIKAEYASDAAREYVRLNQANLDYPTRITIQTLQYDDSNQAVIRKFEVIQIPEYEASEITEGVCK